jgi:carboxyl-terminal processing protease
MQHIPQLAANARNLVLALHLLYAPIALAADPQPVVALPQEEMEKLVATYALIKQSYVGQADDKKLFEGAISGMLASLDAHSQYLDKDAMRDMEREDSGEYVGIGIEVEPELKHEQLRIVSVIADGPAGRAGVESGDVLVSVDGATVTGMKSGDVSRRVHGAPGSVMELGLLRHGKQQTLRIARESLHNETVSLRMAAPGVAWIRVSEFGGRTGAELTALLGKLDAQGTPRGVVLDLRNDPGGMVPAAVSVAGTFLKPDAVVFSARGRLPGANATVTVDPRYYREQDEPDVLAALPAWTRTVPLVVLVNGASASAAELVAGALQDNGRATIVGSQTFGKGSIQSVMPLDEDSGLKFTVARYFTPRGHEIQEHGVTPDIAVQAPTNVDDDLLLREADLDGHLAALSGGAGTASVGRAAVEKTSMFGTGKDQALQTAVSLLAPPQSRSTSLASLLHKWRASIHPAETIATPAP